MSLRRRTPSTITVTTTPQIVTILAISKVDSTRLGAASVTIVPTGVISFTGISPTVAPQGGVLQDIYLAATNVNSLTSIFFDGTALPSTQVVVVSPPTAGSTPTGARARLLPAQLQTAGTSHDQYLQPADRANYLPTRFGWRSIQHHRRRRTSIVDLHFAQQLAADRCRRCLLWQLC